MSAAYSTWRQVGVIVRKELLDGVRDRRSLVTALLFPLMAPLGVGLLVTQIARSAGGEGDLRLPIQGREHAPMLVGFLEEHGVDVEDAPADAEAAIRSGEETVVLRIPADFAEDFRSGRPATVEIIRDSSRPEGHALARRTKAAVEAWSGQIGALRLLARGISPDVARPVATDEVDVATPETTAAMLLAVVNMTILLAAFFCNMYVAIDTSAGERERRSLEALLLNPVPRHALVFAKWTATAIFGAAGVALTVMASGLALARAPLERIGANIDVTVGLGLTVLAVVLPVSLFAAALQLGAASFARSFKEAQTWLSLTALIGTVPGMVLALHPVRGDTWMMAVPVLGQQLILDALVRGAVIPVLHQGLAAGSTLGVGGLCLAGTVWLYTREGMTQAR